MQIHRRKYADIGSIAPPVEAESDEANEALASLVVVTPGQTISTDTTSFLRGHGTFLNARNELVATVAGTVEKTNQLITVKPLVSRYLGEVGDLVVGRVTEVGHKRWKVDVGGAQDAGLQLSAVYLPGGAQRRRTYEDQLQMRQVLVENDVVSAEVQDVRYDGTLSLHTRSLRYGKLENGQFSTVSASLVKRMKQHMVQLEEIGVDVILGTNGYVWISRSMDASGKDADVDMGNNSLEVQAEVLMEQRRRHAETPMTVEDRRKIALVHKALQRLNDAFRLITPDAIMRIYRQLEAQDQA